MTASTSWAELHPAQRERRLLKDILRNASPNRSEIPHSLLRCSIRFPYVYNSACVAYSQCRFSTHNRRSVNFSNHPTVLLEGDGFACRYNFISRSDRDFMGSLQGLLDQISSRQYSRPCTYLILERYAVVIAVPYCSFLMAKDRKPRRLVQSTFVGIS